MNPENLDDIAREVGISRNTIFERIYDFCTLYDNKTPDIVLMFYNKFSQTDDERLTMDEITHVRPVLSKHYDKIRNRNQPQQQVQYPESINNAAEQIYTESKRNPAAYPNPFMTAGQNQQQQPEPPGMDTYEGLLSSICENVPYIQNSKIPKFLNQFALNKQIYARQPHKLLALLKAMFGAMPGELVFMQFMDAAPQFITDPGFAGAYNFNQTPGNFGSTMGYPPGNYVGSQVGQPSQGQDPEMARFMHQQMMEQQAEERRERSMEKRMRMQQEMIQQMVQASMTNMLNRTMENQMPKVDNMSQGADGVWKTATEQYSPDGKVVMRRYEPVMPGMMGDDGTEQQQ